MKKHFGQNFLKSSKYGFRMLEILGVTEKSTFIEIGPGNGAITTALLEKGHKVLSIEIDYDVIPGLIKQFYKDGDDSFDIVHENILEVDFADLFEKHNLHNVYFIGNLPFNIGKHIIYKLEQLAADTKLKDQFKEGVFILQEEVVTNYASKAPEANKYSAEVNLWADIKKYESIGAKNFSPKPKVDAALFTLKPKETIPDNITDIKRAITFGFSSPRKKLRNNLAAGLKIDKSEIDILLEKADISVGARASDVTTEQWIRLQSLL